MIHNYFTLIHTAIDGAKGLELFRLNETIGGLKTSLNLGTI